MEIQGHFYYSFYRFTRNVGLYVDQMRNRESACWRVLLALAFSILIVTCAPYGPYHPNTATEPLNSVRGPSDGRYKFAFIEFGDQGSALDTSQRAAAINVIRQAKRPRSS